MGHKSMIDIARRHVDRLFVFVGDVYEDDLVPRMLRAQWLRTHYGETVQVVAPDQGALTEKISSDDLLERWRNLVLDVIGGPPDRMFGSESYLAHIAASLGAEFVLIDERRDAAPISASQVRADPIGNWDMILPEARSAFRREVVVVVQTEQAPSFSPGVDVCDLRGAPHSGLTSGGTTARPNKLLIKLIRPDQVAAMRAPAARVEDKDWCWFTGPVPIVAIQPVRNDAASPLTTNEVTILSPVAFAKFIQRQLEASPLSPAA